MPLQQEFVIPNHIKCTFANSSCMQCPDAKLHKLSSIYVRGRVLYPSSWQKLFTLEVPLTAQWDKFRFACPTKASVKVSLPTPHQNRVHQPLKPRR